MPLKDLISLGKKWIGMNKNSYYPKKIYQKDNFTFSVEWNDGILNDYRLSELQKCCPCAGCIDEVTGQRLSHAVPVKKDVRAIRITSVGRYALRIQYTSGCSNGIYSFSFLREMKNV